MEFNCKDGTVNFDSVLVVSVTTQNIERYGEPVNPNIIGNWVTFGQDGKPIYIIKRKVEKISEINKMKPLFFIIISICVFCITACNSKTTDLYIKNDGGSSNQIYDLSKDERLILEAQSTNGSAESAFRLYRYYTFSYFSVDGQMKYLERAASLGNVIAQYNYAICLSSPHEAYRKYYDLDKAIQWMRLAAENGDIMAKTELVRLEELKKSKN